MRWPVLSGRTDALRRAGGAVPWRWTSRATREDRARSALHDALRLLDGSGGRDGESDGDAEADRDAGAGPRGCAVCRERDDFARRWLSFFITESHTEEGVRARVRDAAGFCPAHTRYLLADPSASWLMPQVHDLALAGGVRLLADPSLGTAPCPACVNGAQAGRRALSYVERALDRAPVREAVDDGALCVAHVAALAAIAPAQGDRLAAAATERLSGESADLWWLAGRDPDAGGRARMAAGLDALVEGGQRGGRRSVTERAADAGPACCPLCLSEQWGARRLLRWAAAATGQGRPAREETELCGRHLHDLAAIGGPNTAAVLADNRAKWQERMARYRKIRAAGRKQYATAAAALTAPSRCRACDEEATARRRAAALLDAQVRDPVQARAYEHAHGICLRHALLWPGTLPPPVRTVLEGRLALLRWEIDEVLRKQDWHTRHEPRGPETTVHERAPTLLDGRIYAGRPASGRSASGRSAGSTSRDASGPPPDVPGPPPEPPGTRPDDADP